MTRTAVALVSCLLILLASCRKENDDIRPAVRFELPAEYSDFQVGDTIVLVVEASDNEGLERVTIDLVNENFVRVLPAISRAGNGAAEMTVSANLVISDRYLPSGNYYLRAVADDGTNDKTEFIEIDLFELPLEIRRIFCLRDIGPNSLGIDSLDDNGYWVNAGTADVSWNSAVSDPYHGELVLSDGESAEMRFLDGMELGANASLSLPNGTEPGVYWMDHWFDVARHRHFLTGADGWVRSMRSGGIQELSFQVEGNFIPGIVRATDDFILVELSQQFGQQQFLSVYFRNSGVFMQSVLTGMDLVDMVEVQPGVIYLFGNNADNEGRVRRYYVNENAWDEPVNFQFDGIRSVARYAGGDVFVAHATGITRLAYNGNTTLNQVGLSFFGDFDQLHYDAVTGLLMAFDRGNNALVLSNFIPDVIQSYQLPPQAAGYSVLYNK